MQITAGTEQDGSLIRCDGRGKSEISVCVQGRRRKSPPIPARNYHVSREVPGHSWET